LKTLRHIAVTALLAAGFTASASAGTLTYQGVTFTSTWSGNVLTLEIDAAHPTGDWAGATTLGALQLKDIGSFDSVSMTSAPGAATNWTMSSNELNANGCGGGAHAGASLCYSGSHISLGDNMVFQFTFAGGTTDFSSPHLKLEMFNGAGGDKIGSLLSQNIPAVPEPQSYALLLGGLSLVGALARRRRGRAGGA
jgi:hypothetical protein